MDEPTDKIVKEFMNIVKELRQKKGLTIEQLADQAQIHRTTLGLLERGERTPTLGVSNQLAKALETPLSDLIKHAELIIEGKIQEGDLINKIARRQANRKHIRNEQFLIQETGLEGNSLIDAINSCYHTLDVIDEQLTAQNSPPISQLVELANLSSMIGNILASAIAEHSKGTYKRNAPHSYPDLIAISESTKDLELKIALEKNLPKGHLPKEGNYITFRYVLCNDEGIYTRGKELRGKTAWIWETRVGFLSRDDFAISNTEGDSGKTAVVKTESFKRMSLVYFVPELLPYKPSKTDPYPGFN